jgi:hypothetical protein
MGFCVLAVNYKNYGKNKMNLIKIISISSEVKNRLFLAIFVRQRFDNAQNPLVLFDIYRKNSTGDQSSFFLHHINHVY